MKGLWIPIEVLKDDNLTLSQKLILSEINALSKGRTCCASNAHFKELFGFSKENCSRIIKFLERKGYLKITLLRDGKLIKRREIVINQPYCKIYNTPTVKKSDGYCKNNIGVLLKTQRENTLENTLENKESAPEKLEDQQQPQQQPANEYKGGGSVRKEYAIRSLFIQKEINCISSDLRHCKTIYYSMKESIQQSKKAIGPPSEKQIISAVKFVLDNLPEWVLNGYNTPSGIARNISNIIQEIRDSKRQISQKEAKEVQSRPTFAKRQNLPPKNEK